MKIETKLNIGDEAFYMHNNQVQSSEIKHIQINVKEEGESQSIKTQITYTTAHRDTMYEQSLFKSKKDLLDSL